MSEKYKMKKIILASSSPRRKKLLEQLGIPFEIIPSQLEEILDPQLSPRQQVESLALQKATAVAQNIIDEAIIIGADTTVLLKNEFIGKPNDKHDAKRMLKKLSGKAHTVITGFVLLDKQSGRTIVKSVETTVWFKKLTPDEIHNYLETGEPLDKAGAYGINELGSLLIEKIEGDYTNVVGLPLFTFAKELKKLGVTIL